jgi:hypothetical protein
MPYFVKNFIDVLLKLSQLLEDRICLALFVGELASCAFALAFTSCAFACGLAFALTFALLTVENSFPVALFGILLVVLAFITVESSQRRFGAPLRVHDAFAGVVFHAAVVTVRSQRRPS